MPALIGIPGGAGSVSRRGRERARSPQEQAPPDQRPLRGTVSMDCQAVQAAIYRASDNELDGELMLSFRQHLTLCSACSQRYGFVSRLLAIVRVRCCRNE